MGGGQAVFRLLRTTFEMKLVGKCIPAHGQFAGTSIGQMVGDMLPFLRAAGGIAENA